MVNFWTFGADQWWKKKIIEKIPANPSRIMDLACGTGILTYKIARRFPACRVIGVELRYEYLYFARPKSSVMKIKNVEFIQGRAEEVFLKGDFDCITSSYLAKYADFNALIPNAKRMLKQGGVLIIHDFMYPPNRFLIPLMDLLFKVMRQFGTWKFPKWRIIFQELPILLKQTKWVPDLIRGLHEHAFSNITLDILTLGTSAIITARKP